MLLKAAQTSRCQIAASGDRITAEDVKRHIAGRANSALTHKANSEDWPSEPGEILDLCSNRRGNAAHGVMAKNACRRGLRRNHFQRRGLAQLCGRIPPAKRALSFNPLFALLSWQLVQIVKEQPLLNSTMARECRYAYATVNLGFTVQSGEDLFVAVVRGAETMDRVAFAARLVALKNAALNKMLRPEEGAQGQLSGSLKLGALSGDATCPLCCCRTPL